MNRIDAKKIAEVITNEQLQTMFNTAKLYTKDWTAVSIVNKGLTKGTAWNILYTGFDVNKKIHILAKINMIREFGEFLPLELKSVKKPKRVISNPHHEEPVF